MALGSRATVIRGETYRTVPWRNGGGVSRVIAGGDEDGWRISVAAIDGDGWFSDYTGYDRTIVPVTGEGVELVFDGSRKRLDRLFEPFAFAGELRTWCRLLNGPVSDFNVVTQRSRWKHTVNVCPVRDSRLQLAIGPLCFIYVLEGSVLGGHAGDTLRIEGPGALDLEQTSAPGLACVVSLFTATP
jgi:environmental stress-induced protein Ves